MSSTLQESMERISLHDHAAVFHEDAEKMLSAVVPYIRTGLARNEKCLLVCGEDTGKVILGGLRRNGIDVGPALARGAILVIQEHPAQAGGRGFDPEGLVAFFRSTARLAVSDRYAGLRICAEMKQILGKETPAKPLMRYQRMLGEFLGAEKALCLCLHGLGDFSADYLLDALRAHPLVVFRGCLAENFYFLPSTGDTGRIEAERVLHNRLYHLAEREEQMARIQRQAIRLTRFRDIASSLLIHEPIPKLLNRVVEGVVSLGYRMCWVGMAKADGTVEPVAISGDREGYLHEISVRWDDSPLGNGPMGGAIRNGKPEIVRDIARSARFAPWREKALARGYKSVASIPLREEANVVGALTVYSSVVNTFDREAIEELVAFVMQASLALQRTREYSALSLSEERFRNVVEVANALVIEINPDGKIILCNQAAERLAGYGTGELIGRDYPSFVPEREKKRVAQTFREVFAGKDAERFPTVILARDGSERSVLVNATGVRSRDGSVRCILALGIDVTDQALAEREREEFRSRLAHTQKMEAMGAIAGGIAHEFNNLLAVILGCTSLLEMRMEKEGPFLPTVRKIGRCAERAADLAAKLIGFARKGKFNVRRLSLNDVVQRILPILTSTFDRTIEVRTDLDPSGVHVEGDESQLQHSLLNLCLNARDAMEKGGTLTISTGTAAALSAEEAERFHVAGPGDYAFLEVGDTGEGMTEDVQKRIFEPFFTTRRERGNTGLGLPMVYGIVKNHGGGITVNSAPGRGSMFRVYLPVAKGMASRAPREAPEAVAGKGETVLVVDDEPEIRDLCGELLSSLGYKVLSAENGEAACRVYGESAGEIRLVLLDIIMPKMGGRETFRRLRTMTPGIPVLLMSGYSVEGLAQEILDAGANGFIQKPFGLPDLARTIRRYMAPLDTPSGQAGTGA